MKVINWKELQIAEQDLMLALHDASDEQDFLKHIVITLLKQQDTWEGRDDSVDLFDPSRHYKQGQVIALPYQERDWDFDLWKIVIVKTVIDEENPVQGRFQVVQLEGEPRKRVAGVDGATAPSLRLPPEEKLEQAAKKIVKQYGSDFERQFPFVLERCRQALRELFQHTKACSTEIVKQTLREKGFLGDWSEPTQEAVTEWLLRKDYVLTSEGWMSKEQAVKSGLGREVKRRPPVPIILQEIEEEAEEEIQEELATDYAEEPEEPTDPMLTMTLQDWRNLPPPTGPIKLPTLTYQHIVEAYFPLTGVLSKFFPPGPCIGIKITCMDKSFRFWVNREDRTLKAFNEDRAKFAQTLRENQIPAGTYLWLERIDEFRYRLFPKELPQHKTVKAKWIGLEGKRLCCEEIDFPMHYEGNPYLVASELRLEDLEALWEEARQAGMSILQAMREAFQQIDPEGKGVHHTELFNTVFFRFRSCSPKTVLALLYRYQCFEKLGNGRWRYLHDEPIIPKPPVRRPMIRIVGLPESVLVGQQCSFTVKAKQIRKIEVFALFQDGSMKQIYWQSLDQDKVDIPISFTFEQEGLWIVLAIGTIRDGSKSDAKKVQVILPLPKPVRWALNVVCNSSLTDIVECWLRGRGVQGLEAIKQRYRRERV